MIVFGSSISPYVRKVLAFAAEKGIAVDARPQGLGSTDPEFRRASPFGKMPALLDGDFSLADSSAIVIYMDALKPDPVLIPADPRERGRVAWFDEFSDTILFAAVQPVFFNRIVSPKFLGRPGNLAAADKAEAEAVPAVLDYLETQLTGSGFLVGDRLTLADIAVASPFANMSHCGLSIEGRPRLEAYVAGILARPSFADWIARETRAIARAA